jgi:translation initiation factor IF-2
MSDHDTAPMSRDEVRERYGWKEGEREQSEREMAERQARIDAAEQLLARARAAKPQQRDDVVTREVRTRRPQASAPAATPATAASVSRAWQTYIAQRIHAASQTSMRVMTRAIGQTVGKDIAALEQRCAKLEAEVAELRAATEGANVKRIRSVTTPEQLIV